MDSNQNQLNQNSFNNQGNNGIQQNQSSNNMSTNNAFNSSITENTNINQSSFETQIINQPTIDPQLRQKNIDSPTNATDKNTQNLNNKPTKKKILLIIAIIIIIIIISILIIVLFFSKKEEQSDENNYNLNEVIASDKFNFIYDVNSVPETWWNQISDVYGAEVIDYTNRDVFNARYENVFGTPNGLLSIKPVDFSGVISHEQLYGSKPIYYHMMFTNNNFIYYGDKLEMFDHKSYGNSQDLYVLGNDLHFYRIELTLRRKKEKDQFNEDGWKIVQESMKFDTSYTTITAYLPVGEEYCLTLTFPYAGEEEEIKNPKQVLELAKKVTNVISIKSIDENEKFSNVYFNILEDDIKLENIATIHLNKMNCRFWHSGPDSIVGNMPSTPIIKFYNDKEELLTLHEFLSIDDYSFYMLSDYDISSDYNYKGHNITIFRNGKETGYKPEYYYGIGFKAGNRYFVLQNNTNWVNPKDITSIDKWIEELCGDVITFE